MLGGMDEWTGRLRPSEAKVAAFVRSRPHIVADMSLAEVSAAVGVSEPTVLRFCRAIGCGGFYDFKRALLLDLDRRGAARGGSVSSHARESQGDPVGAAALCLVGAKRVVVCVDRGWTGLGRDLAERLNAFGVDAIGLPPSRVACRLQRGDAVWLLLARRDDDALARALEFARHDKGVRVIASSGWATAFDICVPLATPSGLAIADAALRILSRLDVLRQEGAQAAELQSKQHANRGER